MIDLGKWRKCVCKRFGNTLRQCLNEHTVTEQGKSVRLVPRRGEDVLAVVLDGCVITDNDPRCDALFL